MRLNGKSKAETFSTEQFAHYRIKRIETGVKPNTLNWEHAYLRAVFNENICLGNWKKANPLSQLRAFKIQEQELSYLTLPQIQKMLKRLELSTNPHVMLITKVCLAAGESESLRISKVKNGLIQYVNTKSTKARSIPISRDLESQLTEHHKTHKNGQRIFSSAYSAFREALEQASLKLSEGQLTHILGHSFASHFMINGGNIIALSKILGHSSLAMTMRHAHLSPEHLQETLTLNPLAKLSTSHPTYKIVFIFFLWSQ